MNCQKQHKGEGGRKGKGLPLDYLPMVSIVIAVYNGSATIEQAITSVIDQKYPFKELVIIDGGSTDGTLDILNKYDDFIECWVSEPDNGIYDAFNKGIESTHGKWLYFIGCDDLFYDENVLNEIFTQPCHGSMMYGNVLRETSGTVYDGKFDKKKIVLKNICQQAIFYRRDLFEYLGIFDLSYSIYADWLFNMKVFAMEKETPRYIDIIIARYSDTGMSTQNIDMTFIRNRGSIIRNLFGLGIYFYYLRTCSFDQVNLKLRDIKRRYLARCF